MLGQRASIRQPSADSTRSAGTSWRLLHGSRTVEAWEWLCGTLLVAVAIAAINWPLFAVFDSAVPGNLGDPILNVWILGWLSKALAGGLPLWHAPIFHPHENALAFSEPLLGLGVMAVPIHAVVGDHIVTYNLVTLLLPFLTFAGAALLVKELTGRADAGVLVGLLVATSPYLMVSQLARVQVQTVGWSFLALAFLHRTIRTGSRRAALGFTFGFVLQALSNTYFAAYLMVPVTIVVVHAVLAGTLRSRRTLALVAVSLSVSLLSVAPVAWKLASAKQEFAVSRAEGEVAAYSADVRSYVSVWYEQRPTMLRAERTADRALFPGAAVVVLAVAGLWVLLRGAARWRDPACAYVAVAVAAFALSLGPTPLVWGRPVGVPGPYALLSFVVPGFDALRAPSRFAVYVIVALAVLAGVALARWLHRAGARTRSGAFVLCGLVGIAQGVRVFDWVAPLPPTSRDDREAYAWLGGQPPGGLVELPIVADFERMPRASGASQSLLYQLRTLEHGHRLVNGSSAFTPPAVEFLEGDTSPLRTLSEVEPVLKLLRALGVRYLVIHLADYAADAAGHARKVAASIASHGSEVERHLSFGETHAFVLRPPQADRPLSHVRKLPSEVVAMDGPNPSLIPRLNDGTVDERWTAPQRTGQSLRIDLDRERDSAGVTLHLRPHSLADYPRGLRVTGRRRNGTDVLLYEGAGLVELGRQLVAFPTDPAIPLWWNPEPVTALHIEITRDVSPWQWSVHEIDVWESTGSPEGSSRQP